MTKNANQLRHYINSLINEEEYLVGKMKSIETGICKIRAEKEQRIKELKEAENKLPNTPGTLIKISLGVAYTGIYMLTTDDWVSAFNGFRYSIEEMQNTANQHDFEVVYDPNVS